MDFSLTPPPVIGILKMNFLNNEIRERDGIK